MADKKAHVPSLGKVQAELNRALGRADELKMSLDGAALANGELKEEVASVRVSMEVERRRAGDFSRQLEAMTKKAELATDECLRRDRRIAFLEGMIAMAKGTKTLPEDLAIDGPDYPHGSFGAGSTAMPWRG